MGIRRRQVTRIGRNDPCPCGSTKKFKACHGNRTRTPSPDDPFKMSDRLAALLDVRVTDTAALDDDEFRHTLDMAATGWNVAVVRAAGQDVTAVKAKWEQVQGMWEEVEAFAACKQQRFPQDQRMILDVIVDSDETGGRYLQVVHSRPGKAEAAGGHDA